MLFADQDDRGPRAFVNVAHQLDDALAQKVIHLVHDQRPSRQGELLGDLLHAFPDRLGGLDAHLQEHGFHERALRPGEFRLDVIGFEAVRRVGCREGLAEPGIAGEGAHARKAGCPVHDLFHQRMEQGHIADRRYRVDCRVAVH